MSSLKYIFVIEGNNLVRKAVHEAEKEDARERQFFTDPESPSSTSEQLPEPKQRNKRNKTS